jgi:tellurite resistance protein
VAPRALPLNLFAIPLGLSGLGGAWSAAFQLLGAPRWPTELFFGTAALAWAVFTVLYAIRRRGSFTEDRRHPITGPFAAYIPVIGILLAAHYGQFFPAAAPWVVGFFVAALTVVAAQLFARWISAGLPQDALHPGYFLPVVAGAFIASIGLSSVGLRPAAVAAFGVGVFFWLVIGTIVTGRLITGARVSQGLVPSMAVLLAPPATGGIAWFVLSGGLPNPVQDALAGILVIMLLVQLLLIPQYLRVPFSIGYWTFTFPIAATSNYAIRWLTALNFPGCRVIAWAVLGIATAVILTIAVLTVVHVLSTRVLRPRPEAEPDHP